MTYLVADAGADPARHITPTQPASTFLPLYNKPLLCDSSLDPLDISIQPSKLNRARNATTTAMDVCTAIGYSMG
jgi:hypothetical protein